MSMELNKHISLVKKFFSACSLIILILFMGLALFNFTACSYSFSGASVPAHLKTVSIPLISDRSGSGEFDLSKQLTDKLIKQFVDDNSLFVTDRVKSDALIDGTITSLSDAPAVVSGSQSGGNVSARRVTLNVRVVYKDLVKKETILDKSFTNYGDYSTSEDVISGRKAAITTAIDKISEDILLAVVSNW